MILLPHPIPFPLSFFFVPGGGINMLHRIRKKGEGFSFVAVFLPSISFVKTLMMAFLINVLHS